MPLYIVLSKSSFLLKSFWHLEYSYYLCAVNKLAMTYQMNLAQQRNFDFFAFFSALYLVVSDILLTHTHTHTHTHTGATSV